MGNFEKLSVVVIVVIIVMILAVAVVEWTNGPSEAQPGNETASEKVAVVDPPLSVEPPRTDSKVGGKSAGSKDPSKGAKEDRRNSSEPLINIWDMPIGVDPMPRSDVKKEGEGVKSEPSTPTPAPAPAPSSTEIPETTHVVAAGETLSDIAKQHYGKASLWTVIQDANPGIRPETLRKGETLKIPARKIASAAPVTPGAEPASGASSGKPVPGKDYVVQANDTWERISQAAYNTSARWPEIYVKNLDRVSNMKDLGKGKTLRIPK